MEAKGPVTRRKERWMAVALVVLSVAVVALSGALAVVARQENATVIPVEGVETQSGAEPTAVSEAAADPVEELVDEQPDSDKLAATTAAPDTATVEIAGDPPEEPVEENAGADELDATTATPDAATVEAAGDPPEEPVGGLSEDDYAELGELVSKFQDAERQLSETERAALVELASRLRAGTIMFPENGDGQIMYRFYTGKEYPLVVDDGTTEITCSYEPFGIPVDEMGEYRERERKYYQELYEELWGPEARDDISDAGIDSLRNLEIEHAYSVYRRYNIWFSYNVPFLSGNYVEPGADTYDNQGDYTGIGIEIGVCPKVNQSDIAPGSRLSPFTEGVPFRFVEAGRTTVEEIEEWWESRHGGD